MRMFKTPIKLFTFIIILFNSLVALAQEKPISREQVLSDLDYLYQSLIDTHPNVYAYVSVDELNKQYQAIKNKLTEDSYTHLETIIYYQQLTSKVNNGHTEINFPVQPYLNYAQAGGTLFPLEIAFENNKALVRKNWSANENIKAGMEVITINGVPVDTIVSEIKAQISAERDYFKLAKLELLTFPRYYWQMNGRVDNFEVQLKDGNQLLEETLKAVAVFDGFEEKRNDIINYNLNVSFFGNIAYLNPGSFSGDESIFRNFIDNAFSEIKINNTKHLIIDLRNNSGGNDSYSDYMISYIADKPFHWTSNFVMRTSELLKQDIRQKFDVANPYWKAALDQPDGTTYSYEFAPYQPQSSAKRFTGEVYVLINRQSHSMAAVVAAQIQDYGWATLVGEETGDYPSLYASVFRYQLPETGISVQVPKAFITRINGKVEANGVIPDIFIKDHLLDQKDEILDDLLARLQ